LELGMDIKNKNRIGYKETKVGWIPEDWNELTFGQFTKWSSGGTPSKGNDSYWNGDIPWISAISMRGTRFYDSKLKITHAGLRAGTRLAPKNSILLLVRGSMLFKRIPVGIVCRDVAFNQDVKSIIPDTEKVSSEYLLYWLIGNENKLLGMVEGTGIGAGKLDFNKLIALCIPLPSLPEQEAIARVLECWDKAIRNYEKKIEKKRNIKKGLMQRLLSGKQRLPGFLGEWEEVRMGDLYEITSSKRVFQSEWKTEGIPFYRAREIVALSENGLVDNELYISHAMYEEYKRKYGVPQTDDLLVTGVGTVGEVYRVKGDEEFYFKDGNIIWLKNKRVASSEYIEHAFKTRDIRRQVLGCSPITTVATYTIDAAKKTLVYLPPLQEQQAIASVLSEAGAEISALARKLAALQHQKRFLLNNMVTGTIRLPQFVGAGKSFGTNGDNV